MGQIFERPTRVRALATRAIALGRRTDVYVGCAPRTRRHGGRDAVNRAFVLWADCDGEAAVAALANFEPAPSIVIASGTSSNCHAYWPLAEPLLREDVEDANRRLAHALGADLASADRARILRVPSTLSHKHQPPTSVKGTGSTSTGASSRSTWSALSSGARADAERAQATAEVFGVQRRVQAQPGEQPLVAVVGGGGRQPRPTLCELDEEAAERLGQLQRLWSEVDADRPRSGVDVVDGELDESGQTWCRDEQPYRGGAVAARQPTISMARSSQGRRARVCIHARSTCRAGQAGRGASSSA